MSKETIRFVGASCVNNLVLPFFFNRAFSLTSSERKRAFLYEQEATSCVRAYFRRSDYPHLDDEEHGFHGITPSAFAAYALFLRKCIQRRSIRYTAFFHSVGVTAAALNHTEVLQWLIREGIPLNQLNYRNDTVLSIAIHNRHEMLARAVLCNFPKAVPNEDCAVLVMVRCALRGSARLFDELIKEGFPCSGVAAFDGDFGSLLTAAIRRGRNRITHYLLKHAFTLENLCLTSSLKNAGYSAWTTFFREALRKQNREVLVFAKQRGITPPQEKLRTFCLGAEIFDRLDYLKLVEEVYPEWPWKREVTEIRFECPDCWYVAEAVLRYYNLPLYEDDQTDAEEHDWRVDVPTSLEEVSACLTERPENVLRLCEDAPQLLRAYYRKMAYNSTFSNVVFYALRLAQTHKPALFSSNELQELVEKLDKYDIELFRAYAEELQIEVPLRIEDEVVTKDSPEDEYTRVWRIANLRGDALQAYLDQEDDRIGADCYAVCEPIVRFVVDGKEVTCECLELWMERGFGVCDEDICELWYATHFASAEILEYLLTEVGMSARTRARSGDDALSFSIRAGDVESVKIILKHGYALSRRKCRGQYPLTYALLQGEEEIAQVLYAAGTKLLDQKGRVMKLPPWFKPKVAQVTASVATSL